MLPINICKVFLQLQFVFSVNNTNYLFKHFNECFPKVLDMTTVFSFISTKHSSLLTHTYW